MDTNWTKNVKSRLIFKKMVTPNKKKLLIKYFETCQVNLSVLSTKKTIVHHKYCKKLTKKPTKIKQ